MAFEMSLKHERNGDTLFDDKHGPVLEVYCADHHGETDSRSDQDAADIARLGVKQETKVIALSV